MNRKKKVKSAQSTQQLMGIDSLKDYCISTYMGDLVFFIIKPHQHQRPARHQHHRKDLCSAQCDERTGRGGNAGAQLQGVL